MLKKRTVLAVCKVRSVSKYGHKLSQCKCFSFDVKKCYFSNANKNDFRMITTRSNLVA